MRRFNRFYTRQIGVVGQGPTRSPFSLVEARAPCELGQRERPTAGPAPPEHSLDAGYLTRILGGRRLITRTA